MYLWTWFSTKGIHDNLEHAWMIFLILHLIIAPHFLGPVVLIFDTRQCLSAVGFRKMFKIREIKTHSENLRVWFSKRFQNYNLKKLYFHKKFVFFLNSTYLWASRFCNSIVLYHILQDFETHNWCILYKPTYSDDLWAPKHVQISA